MEAALICQVHLPSTTLQPGTIVQYTEHGKGSVKLTDYSDVVQVVRREGAIQVCLVWAGLVQRHAGGHLPQEVVDTQFDAGLVGHDDDLALGGSQALAQAVRDLWLVRVDPGQVLALAGHGNLTVAPDEDIR